jgi:hypothetical protein
MIGALLLAVGIHHMWYALPLVVAVSLVYAGTRHEYLQPIAIHALRFAGWILLFMAVVLLVLMILSYFT